MKHKNLFMGINLLLTGLLLSTPLHASNEVLSVDRGSLQGMEFMFENDAKITPRNSNFTVVNSVLMSSEAGTRVAVVTIRNDASGSRILQAEHIMALFADGKRLSPIGLADSLKLEDGEQRSITISFGSDDFPILAIYTSNNLNN